MTKFKIRITQNVIEESFVTVEAANEDDARDKLKKELAGPGDPLSECLWEWCANVDDSVEVHDATEESNDAPIS